MLTPKLFEDIGTTLHGVFWKRPLARDLDNAIRTVERWADGSDPIPAAVAGELAELCEKRAADLVAKAIVLRRLP